MLAHGELEPFIYLSIFSPFFVPQFDSIHTVGWDGDLEQ
jgi:hypothetical protein